MLEIRELTKSYEQNLAVDQVSFTVEDGTIGILLGPNGAGKSTVIKSIAGLLKYKGEVRIGGFPARSMQAKRIFGYVPELPALFQTLSVEEHLEYIRRAYQIEVTQQEIDDLLRRLELDDKRGKMGSELSKGMMQKVSICCALLIRPRVLLLDEPMVGLDPKAIKELKEIVLELKNQGATHMLEMVEELWDTVYVMEKGKILAVYRRDQVGDQNLDQLFFSVTEREEKDNQEEETS